MKKTLLLTVLILCIGMNSYAQKFAFVDMEYIMEKIPAYEQANEQLNQASQKWQKEVEAIMQEAQDLYKDYQSKAASLSEAQKAEKENAIIAKEKAANELRRTTFGPEGEMAKLQEKLLTPIQDAIYQAIKELADQQGYSAIIDRASASSVIFASPRIDISNDVLARLGYSN